MEDKKTTIDAKLIGVDKLKDYQISIKKSNTSGGSGSTRMILPVSFGELAKQKVGMDPGSRSDTISAESNLLEKINVPTSAFDLNLLAGEMKNMSKDELNVFRMYLGVNRISDPVTALNVASNIKDLSIYADTLDGFEKFRDVPTRDLSLTYDELKTMDRDAFRSKFQQDSSNSLALYQFANFKILEMSREQVHETIVPHLAQVDPLFSIKQYEKDIEGDYDNIDGIIGNNDARVKSSDNRTTEEVVEGQSCDHDGVVESYASQDEENEKKFSCSMNHFEVYHEKADDYSKKHPEMNVDKENENENELVREKKFNNGN